MIRVCTVEAGTTGDQDLLLTEKIKGKLLIILDMELLLIQFREYVESSLWLYNGYTGNYHPVPTHLHSEFHAAAY